MDLDESKNTIMKHECSAELKKELNILNYSDRNTATAEKTPNGLEEFDEILKKVNKGIPNECASLDEVVDVLQNINDDGIDKNNEIQEKYLDFTLEIPKFDFEDLLENNLVRNAYDDKDEYININYWEGLNKADVISLSSKDSQTERNEYENDQTFYSDTEYLNINVHNKRVNNLEPINVDDEDEVNIVIEVEKDKPKETDEDDHNKLRQIDVKYQDPEIVNDDKSIQLNNNKKEDAKMVYNVSKNEESIIDKNKAKPSNRLKETYTSINHTGYINVVEKNDNKNDDCKNEKESEELITKMNNIKFIDDLKDDGYNSSDFEFITEEEAKLDGLINFEPNTHKRKVTNVARNNIPVFATKRQKTAQNDTNVRNNMNSTIRNDTIQSDVLRNTGTNKQLTQSNLPEYTAGSYKEIDGLKGIDYVPNDEAVTGINLGPSHTEQENYSGAKSAPSNAGGLNSFDLPRNMPVNFEVNNLSPARQQETADGFNRFGPGPSFLSRDQRNFTDFDPVIEKWRAFKIRNRNQPFVLDDSYRQTHTIVEGDQFYKLFNPMLNPMVNSIRMPEKKNIFPRRKNLAAYEGIGFDMQMMERRSDGEDDVVKEAARESERRILILYPNENRKRRRSRRF